MSRKYHLVKVFILSAIIMTIASSNYIVRPIEWHELVGPYASARFDVEIPSDFMALVNESTSRNLTVSDIVHDLVNIASSRGARIQDYVIAYELDIGKYNVMALSNISKCSLTLYCHLVAGRRPRALDEALVPDSQSPNE